MPVTERDYEVIRTLGRTAGIVSALEDCAVWTQEEKELQEKFIAAIKLTREIRDTLWKMLPSIEEESE